MPGAIGEKTLKLSDLLDANGLGDDALHTVLGRLLHQVAVQQTGKVAVQSLKKMGERCMSRHVLITCDFGGEQRTSPRPG